MVMIVWFSSTDNSIIFVTEFFSCNSIFQYLWLYAKIVWSKCNNLQIQVITNGGTCNKQIHTMFNQEKGGEKKRRRRKQYGKGLLTSKCAMNIMIIIVIILRIERIVDWVKQNTHTHKHQPNHKDPLEMYTT